MKPAQLEAIRRQVLDGARAIRADGAEVPPALFLYNARPDDALGALTVIDLSRAAQNKDIWAALHQRMARDPSVAASVLILECWTCNLKPGEPLPEDGKVSGRADRTEALAVNVLSRGRQWLMVAAITGCEIEEAELAPVSTTGPNRFEGRFIREER